MIRERLEKGANMLGRLWRSEERCAGEAPWSAWECACDPRRKFCVARELWLRLALEERRELEMGPFGLFEMMRVSEWAKSGLVAEIDTPGIGSYKVGPQALMSVQSYRKLASLPETLASTLTVLRTFRGSAVTCLEDA